MSQEGDEQGGGGFTDYFLSVRTAESSGTVGVVVRLNGRQTSSSPFNLTTSLSGNERIFGRRQSDVFLLADVPSVGTDIVSLTLTARGQGDFELDWIRVLDRSTMRLFHFPFSRRQLLRPAAADAPSTTTTTTITICCGSAEEWLTMGLVEENGGGQGILVEKNPWKKMMKGHDKDPWKKEEKRRKKALKQQRKYGGSMASMGYGAAYPGQAVSGYGAVRPAYPSQPAYPLQTAYAARPPYPTQPAGYAVQPAYPAQPMGYGPRPAYPAQPVGYGARPAYPAQPVGYGARPAYPAQPGYGYSAPQSYRPGQPGFYVAGTYQPSSYK